MIRAILVDDHELFRMGVRAVITERHPDIQIVGEAETGADFFALLKIVQPDIVLLDIMLPDTTGVEIAARLRQEHPDIKILALSAESSADVVKKMLDIGIEGFLSKRMGSMDALAEAIHSVMDGFEYFGKDISDIIYRIYIAKKNTKETTIELTPQEQRIIELCHQGMYAKKIAILLNVDVRTVEKHKENIFKKLGINSTLEMVRYALKNGIIQVE
ncbi:MAG: response regulator transcription factor [Bacteroidales bacterium]|nr:response regulator transcription factor [Bacteroidales bacterium]